MSRYHVEKIAGGVIYPTNYGGGGGHAAQYHVCDERGRTVLRVSGTYSGGRRLWAPASQIATSHARRLNDQGAHTVQERRGHYAAV